MSFFKRKPKLVARHEFRIQVTKTRRFIVRIPGVDTKEEAMDVVRNYVAPIEWDTKLKVLTRKVL